MNKWEHVRGAARDFREKVCGDNRLAIDGVEAGELIRKAAAALQLDLKGLPAQNPILRGALARLEDETIYFRNDVPDWLAAYYQAHEIGHVILGHGERECELEIDPEASETKIPFGVHRVEGYGPQERIECEANIFAREFLLPRNVLTKWFVDDNLKASEISERSGMGIEMVCHQLAFALLTPEITDAGSPEEEESDLTLNDSQKTAAHVSEGPLLVDAGPGTGKTLTLVGRVLHLLAAGTAAENILVLTFSNKAAEELRTRLHRFAPDSATRITIETFHCFGLELLRKYGTEIGLPAKPAVIDPVEAIFLLEKALPDLGLDYYQYLPEPSRYLPDIARAISRAKDENAGPARYLELATKQRELATNDDDIERAEKAIEVAGVYRVYEEKLAELGEIDLGDLICKSILLLSEHENVRSAVRDQHKHVLVDEYQDVNRASGLLLKQIVGDGRNLWAVGDLRQSIHRWRGATTANIRLFSQDFPLAKQPISLAKNYRSRRGIVETFAEFAPQMGAAQGRAFDGWDIHHDDEEGDPSVEFNAAIDPEAEAVGIASQIQRLHESGTEYREQAVICRTHTGMARVARILANANIPILYMGDLFERPEIRDLLSILALVSGPDGSGLVRVARFPEYGVPFDDVLKVVRKCSEQGNSFPAALTKLDEIEGLDDQSRSKLTLIADHLAELTYGRSAWKCLTRYLFDRSSYLKPLIADKTPAGEQRRLAIYQLLQFVHSRMEAPRQDTGMDPKRELLKYIRRLEIFGDEKQLREPDEWAKAIDAVRIMTIHASKGLEFKAVFIPGLSKGNIPNSMNRDLCKPPDGLLSETDPNWRGDEEECLFFVAMSRAREKLYLSRPLTKGNKNSNPSDYLGMISGVLPTAVSTAASWIDKPEPEALKHLELPQQVEDATYRPSDLKRYIDCPLSYFYRNVVGLSGKVEDTAYLQFHRAVHNTLRSLKASRDEGVELTSYIASAVLEKEWTEKGPTDHFLAALYEPLAKQMVANAVERMRGSTGTLITGYELQLDGAKVLLEFDLAELDDGGSLRIQRFRTGRPTKAEAKRELYALFIKAAEEISQNSGFAVETLYLRDNSVHPVSMTDKVVGNRINDYNAAIKGIQDGVFFPIEGEYQCPRCPHYFICPAAA